MPRDFVVPGEVMVYVKGNGALALSGAVGTGQFHELGLAAEQIRITPHLRHRDVHCDGFGPDVPPEVLWQLADVTIRVPLSHHDPHVLDAMLAESMGGLRDDFDPPGPGNPTLAAGLLGPHSRPLGKLTALYVSGNNYFGLMLDGADALSGRPWRFPACYLTGPVVEIPLGTQVSLPVLTVRAIPYRVPPNQLVTSGQPTRLGEIRSSGVALWYRYSG